MWRHFRIVLSHTMNDTLTERNDQMFVQAGLSALVSTVSAICSAISTVMRITERRLHGAVSSTVSQVRCEIFHSHTRIIIRLLTVTLQVCFCKEPFLLRPKAVNWRVTQIVVLICGIGIQATRQQEPAHPKILTQMGVTNLSCCILSAKDVVSAWTVWDRGVR